MTIDWHTLAPEDLPVVEYRKKGEGVWRTESSDTRPFPFTDRTVHRAELTGLEAGTDYEFRVGAEGDTYWFRTMPATAERPIRFIEGGDVGGPGFEKMTGVVDSLNPDFVVIGGDLAYSNGEPVNHPKWFRLFDGFQDLFARDDNRLVPIMMAIGNHEIWSEASVPDELPLDYYRKKYGLREGDAPYYNALMAFPGQPEYGALHFGDYLTWIILDSGHLNPIEGTQKEWLQQTLAASADRPFLFTSYHVPAYPSHRPFEGAVSQEIRTHWVPLFEEYGVDVSFEHHDHTYKRTYPLRQNAIDHENGILYLGDGAWGVNSRELDAVNPRWYLAKAASQRHVILGILHGDSLRFEIVNEEGATIDRYPAASNGEPLQVDSDRRIATKEFEEPEPVLPADSLVLVTLYHQTDGAQWTRNTNWLAGPVETWEGITVTNGRVTRVYLRDNNLKGALPESLTSLTSLERLYIQDNPELIGPFPPGLENLQELYRLRLSGNGFTGPIPPTIGELVKLRQINLGNNRFDGPIPAELARLKLVTSLDLSNNRLSGAIPPELGDMHYRLQWLDLSGNQLTGRVPQELGRLQFLKELDLSDNALDKELPEEVLQLQQEELRSFYSW